MTILGPCPCKGCGKLVYLNDHMQWCDKDGLGHSCVRGTKIGRRYWATGRVMMRWAS